MRADSVPIFRMTIVYQSTDGSLMSVDGYLTADSIESAHRHAGRRIAQWSDAISITLEDESHESQV